MSFSFEIKEKIENIERLFSMNLILLEKTNCFDIEEVILEKLKEVYTLGNERFYFEADFDINKFDEECEIESMNDTLEILDTFIELKDYKENSNEHGNSSDWLKIIIESMKKTMNRRFNYF